MLFTSFEFIFVFLPLAWLVYAMAVRNGWKFVSPALASLSLFFYAWWDARFLPVLVVSMLVNFAIGRCIEATTATPRRKALFAAGVVFNLALLGFFKYADFVITNVASALGVHPELTGIVLPIGISFFTFQQIAYVVDVYAGKCGRYKLWDYVLFVTFFPQLIAGPIVHHGDMMPQFRRVRSMCIEDNAIGLSMFVVGLIKKSLIADNLARFVTPVFGAADAGNPVTSFEAWGAALAYGLQIYYDFSGYSDMAIGIARMFGIRLPVNFNSPYQATSIIEFWRRWHMTLSVFLRDYLYIPLGGNRHGKLRRYANLLLTMILGGLWHGAGWGFIVWGALHGGYLCINHAIVAASRRIRAIESLRRTPAVGWSVTLLAVVLAWVFFRATTLAGAGEIVGAMLGRDGVTLPETFRRVLGGSPERLGVLYMHAAQVRMREWVFEGWPMILMAGAWAVLAPNTTQVFLGDDPYYAAVAGSSSGSYCFRPGVAAAIVTAVAFVATMLCQQSVSEFLYFQF